MILEDGIKIAKERGFFSGNTLAGLQNRKGGDNDMAVIQRASEGGMYISQKSVQQKGIRRIKIVDEFQMVDTDYKGKVTRKAAGTVECVNLNPVERYRWEMNKATQNWLIDQKGDDTEKWIGFEFDIQVKQVGNMNPSVYPKELSLEKVLS